jgi:S-adenosylmethionine:tRNA ribosyltransferase-isomerase
MTMLAAHPLEFEVPSKLAAPAPAEIRGAGRDDVRLMVARIGPRTIEHRHFTDLPSILLPGDLVVINTSATLPAALNGTRADGTELRVHLSTQLSGDLWAVELRLPAGAGSRPFEGGHAPETISLPAGGTADILTPFIGSPKSSRLWVAALRLPQPVIAYAHAHGAPVRYGANAKPWPLEHYQTVYANEPGSAEMPSAGRAFTPRLITQLVGRGIGVAPVVLHTGVSSLEAHEHPYEERYRVPPATARLVNSTRAAGGRVVAVGTTVVRALESVAAGSGEVGTGEGWTGLVITPERGVRSIDGLLTGWHEPAASHLGLVEAVGGRELIETSYRAALQEGYLWHEFGDLHLVIV